MIETFLSPRLRQSSNRRQPVVLTTACASIECGCAAYVGRMPENGRQVAVLEPCSLRHEPLIARAQEALAAELGGPEPLVKLADRVLREAAG